MPAAVPATTGRRRQQLIAGTARLAEARAGTCGEHDNAGRVHEDGVCQL